MDRRRADSSSQLGVGALFPFSPCLSKEHALRKSNRSPTLIMSASNEEEDISITWLLSGGWGTRQGALLRVFRLSVKHSRHFSPRFYMRLRVRLTLCHFPLPCPALLTTALHALSEHRTCLSDVTA